MEPDLAEQDSLKEYRETSSEQAFSRLVGEYIDLVYSAARRQTGDAHLAEDVTQAVFILLHRKAQSLPERVVLGGWLVNATRYVSHNAVRAAARRAIHERKAAEMRQERLAETTGKSPLDSIGPELDAALLSLSVRDRDAVVLHYFQNKNCAEVASAIGASPEAARKRLSRAVARLSRYFQMRGIAAPAIGVEAFLKSRALVQAPAHLSSSIAQGIVQGSAASTAAASLLTKGVLLMTTLTKMKLTALVVIALLLLIGSTTAVIVSARRSSTSASPAPVIPVVDASTQAAIPWKGATASGITAEVVAVSAMDDAGPPANRAGNQGSGVGKLFGFGASPSKSQIKWWAPDGSALAAAPPFREDNVFLNTDHVYRFMVNVDAPDDAGNICRIEPAGGSWGLSSPSHRQRIVYASIPPGRKNLTVRLGWATGSWTTIAKSTQPSAQSIQPVSGSSGGRVTFSPLKNIGGVASVSVTRRSAKFDYGDERFVAVTGNEEYVGMCRSSNGSGNTSNMEIEFPGADPDAIQRIELRSRPYNEWIDLKGISLSPHVVASATAPASAATQPAASSDH